MLRGEVADGVVILWRWTIEIDFDPAHQLLQAARQICADGLETLGMGGDVKDLTPKFPSELLPIIKYIQEQINTLGSFPEIMQGKGEAGVRAGAHAETLMKTASPTLRPCSAPLAFVAARRHRSAGAAGAAACSGAAALP